MKTQILDEQLVLIEYMHPNRGQHSVIGAITKTNYGYRGGSEQFLVHVDDIAAQPMYFRRIQLDKVVAPKAEVSLPPPPVAINPQAELPPEPEPEPEQIVNEALPVDLLANAVEIKKPPIDESAELDVYILTGVTDAIAEQMIAAHLTTPRSILDSGLDGLQELRGVGPNRAQAIVEHTAKLIGL